MVAVETIAQDFYINKYGGIPEVIDLDISIPAGAKLNLSYTVPKGYCFIKVDTRMHEMSNRAFKMTVIADKSPEFQDLIWGSGFVNESFKCVGVGSVLYEGYTYTIENVDSVTRNFDGTIRGFLVLQKHVDNLIKDLSTVHLGEKDREIFKEQNNLLREIRDLLRQR